MRCLKNILGIALSVAMVAAVGTHAEFNEVVDDFSGSSLANHWRVGNPPWATLDQTEGHDASGCMKITAGEGERKMVSLTLWKGPGFPPNPVALTWWYKMEPSTQKFGVQIDLATSDPTATCGGFHYIGQIDYNPWSLSTDWAQDYDDTIPEVGNMLLVYNGGTVRSRMIEELETEPCYETNYTGTAADTANIDTYLIWRLIVENGTVYVDDWSQTEVTTAMSEPSAASILAQPRALVFNADRGVTFPSRTSYRVAVHSPDGRLVSRLSGHGMSASIPRSALPAGSYVVRVTSGLGDVTGRLVID
jgi:hypothetical protein